MKTSLLVAMTAILVVVLSFVPSAVVALGQDTYTCEYHKSVCLKPNVDIDTKYGKLTTEFTNEMNWFGTYANGTIFFDGTGWLGQTAPQKVITFIAEAYGNGTFDIRLAGPPAISVVADTPFFQTNINASWGDGVEILYTRASSAHELTVNYIGTGPGCVLFCWNEYWIVYAIGVIGGPILVAAVVFVRRRRVEDSYIK